MYFLSWSGSPPLAKKPPCLSGFLSTSNLLGYMLVDINARSLASIIFMIFSPTIQYQTVSSSRWFSPTIQYRTNVMVIEIYLWL